MQENITYIVINYITDVFNSKVHVFIVHYKNNFKNLRCLSDIRFFLT